MTQNILSHMDINNIFSTNLLSKIFDKTHLCIPDGDLPEEEFLSKIQAIHEKNNPIIFVLSNGCKLFFTYPEFRRLHGKPEIGKTIQYSLQKLPSKTNINQAYMIKKCIIF